jgi:hypothetical protein
MDVRMWSIDIERMYGKLLAMDPSRLNDIEFRRLINVLMPQTGEWREFMRDIRGEIKEKIDKGVLVSSKWLLVRIRDENFLASLDGNDEFDPLTSALTAMNVHKRSASAANTTYPAKGVKYETHQCANTYCPNPYNHLITECFAYGGDKAGQYLPWWRGPKDLHEDPATRKSAKQKRSGQSSKRSRPSAKVNNAEVVPDQTSSDNPRPTSDLEIETTEVEHLMSSEFPPIISLIDTVDPKEIYQVNS